MKVEDIKASFLKHKESSLYHRYITNKSIEPLLNIMEDYFSIETIGKSVLKKSIYAIKIGTGKKRLLMWSQMHGNESTTTKAIFDLLNTFLGNEADVKHILEMCTIYIIPILNPDGAEAYTRVNANTIDLNRDAQLLSQPESKLLRTVFDDFKPHFCFNLHGQRTIFSAGKTNKPATVSFLAPAQDKDCTITPNRMIAMEVIGVMNETLQEVIPNQVGVYDDAFNINCVGDAFQCENVPTILFEAGHFNNDYAREHTREYIYMSLLTSLSYIARNSVSGKKHETYFKIPENEKYFFDIIIRNAQVNMDEDGLEDIGVLYQEVLINNKIDFIPKIEKIGNITSFFGHKEFDADGHKVLDDCGGLIKVNNEIVFVMLNNEEISLLMK